MDDSAGQLMINTFIALNIITITTISFLENGKGCLHLVNMSYIINNRVISDHNGANWFQNAVMGTTFANNFGLNFIWHFENVVTLTCKYYLYII